jgi:hypothetical protein
MVISFNEMREEDQPDVKIWLDEPELADHFAAIRNGRREQMDPIGTTVNKSARIKAITG